MASSLSDRPTKLNVQTPFQLEAAFAPMLRCESTALRPETKMFAIKRKVASLFAALVIFSLPLVAGAQGRGLADQAPKSTELNDIAISPSRIELVMTPGSEKTLVVNLIYTSDTGTGQPTRVIGYLGDWTITRKGKLEFYQAGSRENSASSWLVYSPSEVTVLPGRTHAIRVTVSVPKDASPGEHITALFVEPRPDDIKFEPNKKQVRVKFRLAAVFYIMVPTLTQDASLENLKAEANEKAVIVTPLLKNRGNIHVRPAYSIKLLDRSGIVVAGYPEAESLPVLAGSETEIPVLIETALPPGSYSVQYRVRFSENGPLTEGRAALVVVEQSAQKGNANGTSTQEVKPTKDDHR